MKSKKITTLSFEAIDTTHYEFSCKLNIKYSDIYKKSGKQSDYSKLKVCKNSAGIYFFADENNTIIYIGESHDRCLYKRITQHFSEDHGGLRYKLKQVNRGDLISELEGSTLYVFEYPNATKKEILYAESYFIGLYKPKINFIMSFT